MFKKEPRALAQNNDVSATMPISIIQKYRESLVQQSYCDKVNMTTNPSVRDLRPKLVVDTNKNQNIYHHSQATDRIPSPPKDISIISETQGNSSSDNEIQDQKD